MKRNLTDAEAEKIARVLAPRSWEVFDGYLAEMLRKYKGENAAYDPSAFKDKASMSQARAAWAASPDDDRWRPISEAGKPHIGGPIIGADFSQDGQGRIFKCWWQPEFDAWITGCRQMVMAEGYLIDGKTSKLHSPDYVWPTHFRPLPPPLKGADK